MDRRAFIATVGIGLLAIPTQGTAQPPPRVPRVGYLFSSTRSAGRPLWEACRQGLRDLHYVEGRNIVLEPRWTEGHHERLPELAAELVRLDVDVIVSAATPASRAAKAATTTIPIVFVAVAEPMRAGLVASLARPGGNVTGLSLLTPELSGKRLQLLSDVVPGLTRVAVLTNPDNLSHVVFLEETWAAARAMGIQLLQPLQARGIEEIEQVLRAAEAGSALIVFDDPVLWSHRRRIVALAAERRLAVMYGYRDFVDEGGLMSYGPDRLDLYRRTATYVDKILKGSTPRDLPVQQPTKFDLVVNLKAARAQDRTIPSAVLQRADQAIQ